MSARTDALLKMLQQIDQDLLAAHTNKMTNEDFEKKKAERARLAQQLEEANIALDSKKLLKG